MRLNADETPFRKWLLKIGDGEYQSNIEIPEDLRSNGNLARLIFTDSCLQDPTVDLTELTILTPKNAEALKTNEDVLERLPGHKHTFRSEDEAMVEDKSDALNIPAEFLNKMTSSSLSPHELHLKTGCIAMLLRNLDVKNGLCNGTRLIVSQMLSRVVVCKFATGSSIDTHVLIPRIDSYYTHVTLPFRLRRRQFPIRSSFCMTISKSQGQSFSRVGIDLNEPIFTQSATISYTQRSRELEVVRVYS